MRKSPRKWHEVASHAHWQKVEREQKRETEALLQEPGQLVKNMSWVLKVYVEISLQLVQSMTCAP